MARPALAELVARRTIDDAAPWLDIVEAGLAALPLDTSLVLVHGDFYSRHVLVDETGGMAGVIDFGDLHVGHPAVDLSDRVDAAAGAGAARVLRDLR